MEYLGWLTKGRCEATNLDVLIGLTEVLLATGILLVVIYAVLKIKERLEKVG